MGVAEVDVAVVGGRCNGCHCGGMSPQRMSLYWDVATADVAILGCRHSGCRYSGMSSQWMSLYWDVARVDVTLLAELEVALVEVA